MRERVDLKIQRDAETRERSKRWRKKKEAISSILFAPEIYNNN
jgi:hypothetical protein